MLCKAGGLIAGVYKKLCHDKSYCYNEFMCEALTSGIICVGTDCSLVHGSLPDLFSNAFKILSFCCDLKLARPVNYITLHYILHFIGPSVYSMAVAVKPVIYHNS